MALIRPFAGLRPPAALAEKVASPPYDVLSSEEARAMAEGNDLSFLHVIKPEIDLPADIHPYDDRVYAQAAAALARLEAEGALVQDPEPWLYLYRQRMGDHEQYGLMACVSAREYEQDLIKKHEFTRPDKEDDRTRHVSETNVNAGPVFLTYRGRPDIDALVAHVAASAPEVDFIADDGVVHTLWVVRDRSTLDSLIRAFTAVDALYVADGHHRSASAARVAAERAAANPDHRGDEEYNFFLAVLFPHDHLQILPYNRLVQDLGGLSPDALLDRVGERFAVSRLTPEDDPAPARPREFGMYLQGRWYRLTAKEGTFEADHPVRGLDVAILQDNLLGPVLGIGDPRKDQRIDFVGGIRGLAELERRCGTGSPANGASADAGAAVAFALYPTTVEQLLSVADAGEVMPPKSTWFEPKLRSGLVIHRLS
jgi:uncharacterized protein (DUF1015 family)